MSRFAWDMYVTPVLFAVDGRPGALARQGVFDGLEVEVLVDVADQIIRCDLVRIHRLLEDLRPHQPVEVALVDLEVALTPFLAGLIERPLLRDGLEQGRRPIERSFRSKAGRNHLRVDFLEDSG